MWTPRRILLLLLGIAGFVGAFFVYSRFFGSIDGLPELPAELATDSGDSPEPIQLNPSSTVLRLAELFGPDSMEVNDPAYSLKLEMREKGVVIASGQPRFAPEPSKYVTVSPFSVGFFEKPRSLKLAPGESVEASTFHADRAILEFDQEVRTAQDISGKAKLVGMELVSVHDLLSRDDRKGKIVITNNQRSIDRNQHLIFRTNGPLHYRAPDKARKPAPDAPQIWTAAEVEVVDRRNLPRPLRSNNTKTAATRGDDLRHRGTVEAILSGALLPPPTITAVGMKVYLSPEDDKGTPRKSGTGFSGVRSIELGEKVRFCQWSDGSGGLFPAQETEKSARPATGSDPPELAGALVGGFSDGATVARLMASKTVMVIEAPGAFRYDFQTNVAQFDAAAVDDQAVPNHVAVARLSASGKQDSLFCRRMVVEFTGGPEAAPVGKPSLKTPDPKVAAAPKSPEPRRVKNLVATGQHVYVAIESEQLEAQGNELRYSNDATNRKSLTILRGSPVTALREKNKLEGGNESIVGEVVIATVEPPPDLKNGRKQTAITVNGRGRIEIFDQAANAQTLHASWGQSLTHEKVMVGNAEQDLLKFAGGGVFHDTKGNMRLSADLLKLWLAAPAEAAGAKSKPNEPSSALPQQLQAIGHVESSSPDLVIKDTDHLTLWFRDVAPPEEIPPPKLVAGPKPATPVTPAPTPGPVTAKIDSTPVPPKPAEKTPAPPVHLSARVVESWIRRYQSRPTSAEPGRVVATTEPAKSDAKKDATPTKYELERALCEDRVVVHQDPADPVKNPRGLDIRGVKLNLDGSKDGSVMKVTGSQKTWAEVHFEGISLYGPTVVIDQPQNAASVDGAGAAELYSQPDPSAPGEKPTVLKINWLKSMNFEGAKARAEFLGMVKALQQPAPDTFRKGPELAPTPRTLPIALLQPPATPNGTTVKKPAEDDGSYSRKWLLCHRLDVTFDRPVYFNNYRRSSEKPPEAKVVPGPSKKAESDAAKLETALCVPIPDDELAKLEKPPLRNWVTYLDETFTKEGKLTKSVRIDAPELSLRNGERERVVFADGPGEVRLLEPGSKEGFEPARQSAGPPPATKTAKKEEQEMKLTYVRYLSKMRAEEKGKTFQQVTFLGDARVWHVPSEDLYLRIEDHLPPKRAIFLSCTNNLVVSTDRAKGEDQVEQWMTATGDAQFSTEDYFGSGNVITYAGKAVTIEGRPGTSLARLRQTRRGVNQDPGWNAERITYYKSGHVVTVGNASGVIIPGQ